MERRLPTVENVSTESQTHTIEGLTSATRYEIVLVANNPEGAGRSDTIEIVTLANTPPTSVTINGITEVTNPAEIIVSATASDINNDVLTYTWSVPANSGSFSDGGIGSSITYRPPDVTTITTVTITVIVNDGQGGSAIGKHNVVVNPPVVAGTAPTFTNGPFTTINVVENVTEVGITNTFITTGTAPVTVALGGSDSTRFTLDGNGTLTFNTAPNFELPRGNPLTNINTNTYVLTVTAENTVDTINDSFTVVVGDVNETPPVITPIADITSGFIEHTKGTFTVQATDEDVGQTITYALAGERYGATITQSRSVRLDT